MNKTKRRIFQTAIKLFAEKGYDNTGIEEITAVAGYAKGALYYHFETKEDLFDMVLEEGLKLLNNSLEIKFRKCSNAVEKLKAILKVEIKCIIRYEDFVTVIINNILGENSRTRKCKNAFNKYVEMVQNVVQEGMDSGYFHSGDAEGIACGIIGVTFSSLLYRLKRNRNLSVDDIYNGYVETVIRGMIK